MANQAVRLLYALRFFRGNREQKVNASGQPTASLARKPRCEAPCVATGINGAEDVTRLAAGADGNEDVSFGG